MFSCKMHVKVVTCKLHMNQYVFNGQNAFGVGSMCGTEKCPEWKLSVSILYIMSYIVLTEHENASYTIIPININCQMCMPVFLSCGRLV